MGTNIENLNVNINHVYKFKFLRSKKRVKELPDQLLMLPDRPIQLTVSELPHF